MTLISFLINPTTSLADSRQDLMALMKQAYELGCLEGLSVIVKDKNKILGICEKQSDEFLKELQKEKTKGNIQNEEIDDDTTSV
jgi:hypothetical protein